MQCVAYVHSYGRTVQQGLLYSYLHSMHERDIYIYIAYISYRLHYCASGEHDRIITCLRRDSVAS